MNNADAGGGQGEPGGATTGARGHIEPPSDSAVVGLFRIVGGSFEREGPVTDEEADAVLWLSQFQPEPSDEEVRRVSDRLLMRLKHDGGRWVPSNELTPMEIALAQAACDDRWYVNQEGFGWAWFPDQAQ